MLDAFIEPLDVVAEKVKVAVNLLLMRVYTLMKLAVADEPCDEPAYQPTTEECFDHLRPLEGLAAEDAGVQPL